MNKKHIFIYLLMALPLMLTSCLKDQEDIFDESASIRSANYLENARKVLTSSANGWLLNYYPDREQSYGGFAYTLKFDDENVTVSCELANDIDETLTTTYILDNEDGPCLAFDTYNDYLHFFATPTGSSGAGGYEAYDGDFIFIILDISEDKNTITLKGNRSGNIMYMHRLTEDGAEYLKSLVEVSEVMPTNYTINDNIKVVLTNGKISFTGEGVEEETSFHYTSTGIGFYEPVTILGQEITGIQYAGEAAQYPSVGGNIMFTPIYPPITELFIQNDWYFAYSMLGEFAQPYFMQAKLGSDGEGETIAYLAFSQMSEGSLGLYFNSGGYAGALGFDYEIIGDDEIKLTYNAANNAGNGNWYYTNAGYNYLVTPLQSTFKLEPNNKVKPSVIKMIDQERPTNIISVTTSQVSPFDY